jgi:hypothetical protein
LEPERVEHHEGGPEQEGPADALPIDPRPGHRPQRDRHQRDRREKKADLGARAAQGHEMERQHLRESVEREVDAALIPSDRGIASTSATRLTHVSMESFAEGDSPIRETTAPRHPA